MASEIKVDTIVNAGGDNDTGIDLATNDQILLKVANATKLTMNSTGQTTIVGEGGTTTTSVQQGLAKGWAYFDMASSFTTYDTFNVSSISDSGAGDGRANLTNVMTSATRRCMSATSGASHATDGGESASQIQMVARNNSHTNADDTRNSALVWGDLA